jgi:hypothetical protein
MFAFGLAPSFVHDRFTQFAAISLRRSGQNLLIAAMARPQKRTSVMTGVLETIVDLAAGGNRLSSQSRPPHAGDSEPHCSCVLSFLKVQKFTDGSADL